MRNMLRSKSVRADAAGMPFFALPCDCACTICILRQIDMSSSLANVCVPFWCRSSTVVSVTYLDDRILSFVGALAMTLGTDVTCGDYV